jgi:hypothetical protein
MQLMLLILHGSNAGMQTAERRGMGPCKCKHSRGSLAEGHDTSEPAPSLCLDPGTSRPVDSSVSLARWQCCDGAAVHMPSACSCFRHHHRAACSSSTRHSAQRVPRQALAAPNDRRDPEFMGCSATIIDTEERNRVTPAGADDALCLRPPLLLLPSFPALGEHRDVFAPESHLLWSTACPLQWR